MIKHLIWSLIEVRKVRRKFDDYENTNLSEYAVQILINPHINLEVALDIVVKIMLVKHASIYP